MGIGAIKPDDLAPPADPHTSVEPRLDGVAASVDDLLPADRTERTVERGDAVGALRAASADAQLVVVGARGVGAGRSASLPSRPKRYTLGRRSPR